MDLGLTQVLTGALYPVRLDKYALVTLKLTSSAARALSIIWEVKLPKKPAYLLGWVGKCCVRAQWSRSPTSAAPLRLRCRTNRYHLNPGHGPTLQAIQTHNFLMVQTQLQSSLQAAHREHAKGGLQKKDQGADCWELS